MQVFRFKTVLMLTAFLYWPLDDLLYTARNLAAHFVFGHAALLLLFVRRLQPRAK